MNEEIVGNSEVFNYYLELSKPTEEDFKRIFTEYELRDLCLKHKCRVDMYRWNAVNNYRILFTESGRYQRWSESDRLGMLAKAVNRFKPTILYTDEEIRKDRKEDWEFQLKENILSLNYWLRKQSKTPNLDVIESDRSSREMQSQFDVNTESMRLSELCIQAESVPTGYRELDQEVPVELEVHTDSMNMAELLTKSQRHQIEFEQGNSHNTADSESMSTEEQPESGPRLAQSKKENIPLVFLKAKYFTNHDSEDSIETVIHEHLRKPVVEKLHSEEITPEVENIYGVNAKSMTIDSQMSTQDLKTLQAQDVPANCNNLSFTQSESMQIYKNFDEVQLEIEVSTESMNEFELSAQSQRQQREFEPEVRLQGRKVTAPLSNQSEERNILLALFEAEAMSNQNSEDAIEAVLHDHRRKLVVQTTDSAVNASEMVNEYGVNTESITIESQMSTQVEENFLLDEDYLACGNSSDSIETVIPNAHQRKLLETLHSEEVAPGIENIYGVNTMSMSIDSQMSTPDLTIMQSEEIIP